MSMYGGVYIGMVIDSDDPMSSGRARVAVPAMGVDGSWAPVCRAAGAPFGVIPVGSRVVVAFEGGDPTHPVILGQI